MASLTAEAPDAKTFSTWEDAFKYPVPAVRRLQQQLRGDISSNRVRLRALVGGSYRELLGTAGTIVQMDGQMQEVEAHLGETSAKCNTSRLGKSFRHQGKLVAETKDAERRRFATASQLAVLQRCPEALVRVVRRGGSVLQAAKVLIIARRLYRKLAESSVATAYVEKLWARLGKLRQKVLQIIDRRLVSTSTEPAMVVDALCAYALAASSASASDLLRHFHHVRMDALKNATSAGSDGHASVVEGLGLWIRTLEDTRTVFPKQLAASLSKLKSAPLLKDEGIQSITEFDLEIHEPWLGDDVRNFMPYIKHDDLTVAAASQQLSVWAPAALKTLLSNVKSALEGVEDLKTVDEMRRGCLERLFSHYHIPGVRKEAVLSGFRETFEKKLLELVQQRCRGLQAVSDLIKSLIDSWSETNAEQPPGLWSEELVSMDTSKGAAAFTDAVQTALEGRTPAVKTAMDAYHVWLSRVEDITRVVESMRSARWDEHLDTLSDSDTDSDSDAEATSSRKRIQTQLSSADPAALDAAFAAALSSSTTAFTASLAGLASSFSSAPDTAQAQAAFVLRTAREVRRHPPPTPPAEGAAFASALAAAAPPLHALLAAPAVDAALAKNAPRIARAARAPPAGRDLWQGDTPLPALPSPWSFRFLRDLEAGLAALGSDLWTPQAAAAARARAHAGLGRVLRGALERGVEGAQDGGDGKETQAGGGGADAKIVEGAANAEGADNAEGAAAGKRAAETEGAEGTGGAQAAEGAKGASAVSWGRDAAVQLLFDVHFLGWAGEGGESQGASLRVEAEGVASLQQADLEAINGAAGKYRERTALLFPLANGAD